jgi:hypothetical protein
MRLELTVFLFFFAACTGAEELRGGGDNFGRG